jgi:hypothetical protein
MTKIHMETEQVRMAARSLNQKVDELLEYENNLKQSAARISSAWYGGNKPTKYHMNLKNWLASFENQITQLENLSLRLTREVDEWELADRNGNSSWKNVSNKIPATIGIGAGVAMVGKATEKFDWYKTGSTVIDRGLKILGKVPYDSTIGPSWKGVGRLFNFAQGNLNAGWVGKMDGLGHIIKNPAISKGLPYGLGVMGDLLDGDRLDRALGSEAIETAAEWGVPLVMGGAVGGAIGGVLGLGAGGVGAIPGAIAGAALGAKIGVGVYAVYQWGLAAGNIFSGGLELAGYDQQALWLQNELEPLDFGERIGDTLYDSVYDFVDHKI